jgi:acylphosphatase
MTNAAAHIVVRGMVQGVGFRYFVLRRAQELGVRGWVRNCASGEVEIEAEGDKVLLDRFVDFVQRGPRLAVVSEADVEWKEYVGRFQTFEISY